MGQSFAEYLKSRGEEKLADQLGLGLLYSDLKHAYKRITDPPPNMTVAKLRELEAWYSQALPAYNEALAKFNAKYPS
jgi:hypothetical protein